MAFIRPIVFVYQEFQDVVVAPGAPDLNVILVGPAYHIQDYPVDKTYIYAGDFVKTGQTVDAACLADGSSAGQPDPGSDILDIAEPPNHIAGGVLDEDSVQVILDDVYIDLNHGADGAGDGASGAVVAGENVFISASGDFENKKVAPGDRLVMTDPANPGDLDYTVIKRVKEVVDATTVRTTTTFKAAEIALLNAAGATPNVLWRVEHQLDDQVVDAAYYTVLGNEVIVKTGPTGLRLTYESLTWASNFGKVYLGYRELRTDLQKVQEISQASGILSAVGRIDERNPLAGGAQVAMSNTGTGIQVYGVASDDLAGHQAARDGLTTRSDIYAIVPMNDSISGATWVTIIAMWKAHVLAFADPAKSKFRVVIGSYDVLPTEKSSAPPSDEGSTEFVGDADVDVFVDPHAATNFLTAGITAQHLLDVTHADGTPDLLTVPNGETIFTAGYFAAGGAKDLLGVIGGKRLRAGTAWGPASTHAALDERMDYFVREAILDAEGGTPIADVDSCNWTDDTVVKITKPASGEFADVQVGDIAKVTGADTAAHNDGFLVIAKTADDISIEMPYAADANTGSITVEVYRPILSANDCAFTDDHTITKAAAFTGAAVGDMAVFLVNSDNTTDNRGMFVVTGVTADTLQVAVDATYKLVDPSSAIINVAIYHTKASRGVAAGTARPRYTRLRDDTASFLTTVSQGESIEIPYPAEVDPLKWDTDVTSWLIDAVVSDEVLDASLTALEELAPKAFKEPYAGDMFYRISIALDKDGQVRELGTITTSLSYYRCLMVWPNECYVASLENELTEQQNKQSGQYMACAVGGMVAGLPSHQGFTYIGIGGIEQIFNSNDYFKDDQLTDLRDFGWYVFVQESETSLPYTIHEVTTEVSTYAFGEFMNVKNFDYISTYMKEIVEQFLGKWNILPETISAITGSLNAGARYLQLRRFPKIGVPLISATIGLVEQIEIDRLELYMDILMPKVLNQIGLHLLA
jgi:hypothetical protein